MMSDTEIGYCPYGGGLCKYGGIGCGKGMENLIQCRMQYETDKYVDGKSLVSQAVEGDAE